MNNSVPTCFGECGTILGLAKWWFWCESYLAMVCQWIFGLPIWAWMLIAKCVTWAWVKHLSIALKIAWRFSQFGQHLIRFNTSRGKDDLSQEGQQILDFPWVPFVMGDFPYVVHDVASHDFLIILVDYFSWHKPLIFLGHSFWFSLGLSVVTCTLRKIFW